MALKPIRQQQESNIDWTCPWTQERGGILTYATVSGCVVAQYAGDPINAIPIGLQLNDIEHMNLSLHVNPQHIRNVDMPCAIVGIATQGDYETDWLTIVGSLFNGDIAYVGPSGTITNSASFGGAIIGKFIGPLKPEPHVVTMRGMGFSRQYIDTCTKELVWENNPANRVLVTTPGFARVRILF